MSLQQALTRLLRDLEADAQEYHVLHALLEDQFIAALGHDGARLEVLATDIMATVARMDTRRQARVVLVQTLLAKHPHPTMDQLIASLSGKTREVVATCWSSLQILVRECKACNVRNGRLLTDQQAIFQRVLKGEEAHTYVET
jgi:flagella synthesis protein FlgN